MDTWYSAESSLASKPVHSQTEGHGFELGGWTDPAHPLVGIEPKAFRMLVEHCCSTF